jgi:hypothetical protein
MENNYAEYFLVLIGSLELEAMIGMGKLKHPLTDKIERDLGRAKHAIDMLEMLQAKTKGNLSDEEYRYLDNMLFTLRRNYIDEASGEHKEEVKAEEPAPPEEVTKPEEPEAEPKAEEKPKEKDKKKKKK